VSFYVSTATYFLLHCDEWDRVVALSRHKFVTGATLLQLVKHRELVSSSLTCGVVRVVHIFQLHVFMFLAPCCDVPYVLKLSSLKQIALFFVFCLLVFCFLLFFVVVVLFVYLFCFVFVFFLLFFLLFFLVFVFALFLFLFVCLFVFSLFFLVFFNF